MGLDRYASMSSKRVIACLATVLMCGSTSANAAEPGSDEVEELVVEAIWKPQRIRFEYRGYNTHYTCGALASRLRKILTRMGAYDNIQVDGVACDASMGLARFEVRFLSPVIATPENVQQFTTYTTEQELIARLHGKQLPSANDLPRFPAEWTTISFANDRKMRLQPGDCALVQQVARRILTHMSVRVLKDARCSEFGDIRPPSLTVAALIKRP